MDLESEENITVDFKKFKGHHRKFPWALLIRIFVAIISIAIIFFLVQYLDEVRQRQAIDNSGQEIEIEFEP
jgi:hypothetical protein